MEKSFIVFGSETRFKNNALTGIMNHFHEGVYVDHKYISDKYVFSWCTPDTDLIIVSNVPANEIDQYLKFISEGIIVYKSPRIKEFTIQPQFLLSVNADKVVRLPLALKKKFDSFMIKTIE